MVMGVGQILLLCFWASGEAEGNLVCAKACEAYEARRAGSIAFPIAVSFETLLGTKR